MLTQAAKAHASASTVQPVHSETGHPQPLPQRPSVRGKFLFVGDTKYFIKGVTYGTFEPRPDGAQFPDDAVIDRDFAAMAQSGFNTVRVYTPPPTSLLDAAWRHGLRVMIGLAWTQHVAFLDDPALRRTIRASVRQSVRACARHRAVLCYAIGNEIPATIVRWHGRRQVEKFLSELCEIVRSEDPEGLVTYVNFPTTEYLQLPFLDFVAFNVYLESRERLQAYLARLQNLAGEKPLVLAEIGLDSRRNGESEQAGSLDWQIRAAFRAGCAGTCVFAWTDEWYRGGFTIDDWDFGLTARDRSAKPALAAVSAALRDAPIPVAADWPDITVVVCSLNGAATLRDTMEGLAQLDYPKYDVIVVDDGSTDDTAAIAGEYPWRVISTENRGLSNARNTGWQEATGSIVAYIDDDAYPDPDWLTYLAAVFMDTDYVGVGGPNLAPPGDGRTADCVANAPGGPVQVLLSDTEAEHIPGCNMAFRRDALAAINGFDPIYRAAGDDVDLCWRLQDNGGVIGFAPAAVVWHHRRNSARTYWKQQIGYGKAEALLEQKWPERYNALGHLTWSGRLYGKGLTQAVDSRRWHIYQGQFGQAPFQSLYQPASGWTAFPLMPEWYLLVAGLTGLAILSVIWAPLKYAWPLALATAALPVAQALLSAAGAEFTSRPESFAQRAYLYGMTAAMHLVQPMARLIGRIQHGLTLWRNSAGNETGNAGSRTFTRTSWQETWRDPAATLAELLNKLRAERAAARANGSFDDWDIEVRGGLLGVSRLTMAVEEHGGGKQLLRFKALPHVSRFYGASAIILGGLAIAGAADKAWLFAALALGTLAALTVRLNKEQKAAANACAKTLNEYFNETEGH